jgi:hypothetical protein
MFTPSGLSAAFISAETRCTIRATWPCAASEIAQMSRACSRGTTSVCPREKGRTSRKAMACSSSRTRNEDNRPATISQKVQSRIHPMIASHQRSQHPAPRRAEDDHDWGELHLRSATPDAGGEWTDDGSARELRQLKHRAEGDSRIVPTHPELTALLRDHLAQFGTAPDGRLFSGVRGGELPTITYRRAWIKARLTALTASEQASPLARRPYDCGTPAEPDPL